MVEASVLDELAQLDPTVSTPHYNLGVMYQRVGDFDSAEAEYRRAIVLDPMSASAHNNLADLLQHDRKDYSGAEAEFRKVVELEPQEAPAHFHLGCLLNNMEKYNGAEKEWRVTLKIDPKHVQANVFLAGILTNQRGDYVGAEAMLREAIKLDPKNASAYSGLGYNFQGLARLAVQGSDAATAIRHYTSMAEAFREAIKIDPTANIHRHEQALNLANSQRELMYQALQEQRSGFNRQPSAHVHAQLRVRQVASQGLCGGDCALQ